MSIDSSLITLKEIVEQQFYFSVPIYQRLYVWEEDQIKTLLEDIETAYSDKKDIFYLGGVLVVENEVLPGGKVYDLIDGQQRFTTLWMIAIVFGGAMMPFIEQIEKDKNRHRVTFAIRNDIYNYFKEYINGNRFYSATSHIVNALSLIQKFRDEFEREQPGKSCRISEYIYEKVKLIFTEIPKQTDLNKLFEIINNRGVQLQHHEILKAQLIYRLPPEDRLKYSHLWDACSYMESYIEKNIRDIAKIRVQELFENDDSKSGCESIADPTVILKAISISQNYSFSPLSLSRILQSTESFEIKNEEENEEYEADEIRSIITFPMLLQHTLRIYLVKKNKKDIPKILDKELLGIFSDYFLKDNPPSSDIITFIELLWRIRYLFDKHVIKWVRQEESEIHLICKLEKYESRGKNYLRRRQPQTNESEALLQSMLYHSQQITTHYWLTPFLNYLNSNKGISAYEYLIQLDNNLHCSSEQEPLVVRTRKFLENPKYKAILCSDILNESLGTAFPHYWFYKLEFILWYKYGNSKDERWKNFRITAKNSVEHISPRAQKETDTNTVSDNMLNSFGNLSLVSRSINSEYSNLPFNEKRQRFINNNRMKLDSLKMDMIYCNEIWNDDLAKIHQAQMKELINEYLGVKL